MKTSFLKSVFIWIVTVLFIFTALYPVLLTTFFVKDIAKTETKTVVKTIPKEIVTNVCYVNESGKNYHSSGCVYKKESAVKTTVYEATIEGYGECQTCDYQYFAKKILIVDEESKTVTQTEKETKEYNYFYPLAICSVVSFFAFIPIVLVPLRKERN